MSTFEFRPAEGFPSEVAVPGMGGSFEPEAVFERTEKREETPHSAWDARALEHIERHLESERVANKAYREMFADSSGAAAYLLDLVLADEARHQRVFAALANAVGAADGLSARTGSVPPPTDLDDKQRAELLAEARHLLEIEQDDVQTLLALRNELEPARTGTIWPLLVELMALDTEKHLKVLDYLEETLSN